MKHILKCQKCSQYTMKDICPKCKSKAIGVRPAKWSPDDPYGDYRRQEKKQRGLI